jgi:serine/threonine protein kinase
MAVQPSWTALMSIRPETIGRYRVVRSLGEGGMGSVYVALDPDVDRLVAIKLIYQARGSDPAVLRERFKREARAVGSLRHINIVTLYEFGAHEGEPFIAMEYVEGQTLARLIRSDPPLTLTRRLEIIEQACAGFHHAHAHGLVHRDIKPANVMVDTRGVVKILDFGIARGANALAVTVTGVLMGSLSYMSPEQLGGRPVDARSDIFSLGAVLYELITGELAFPGEVETGLLTRILDSRHASMAQSHPDVPDSVVAIVDRMLEKDPARRYPTMDIVRQALANARAGIDGSTAPYVIVEPIAGAEDPAGAESQVSREPPTQAGPPRPPTLAPMYDSNAPTAATVRHRPRFGTALLAAAVIAAAGIGWAVWLSVRGPRQTPPPVDLLPGTVAVEILPWANVRSIVRKTDGANVAPPNLVTPDVLSLPPGDYRLTATHPRFEALDVDFTVTSGAYVELRRSLRGVKSDEAATVGLRRR